MKQDTSADTPDGGMEQRPVGQPQVEYRGQARTVKERLCMKTAERIFNGLDVAKRYCRIKVIGDTFLHRPHWPLPGTPLPETDNLSLERGYFAGQIGFRDGWRHRRGNGLRSPCGSRGAPQPPVKHPNPEDGENEQHPARLRGIATGSEPKKTRAERNPRHEDDSKARYTERIQEAPLPMAHSVNDSSEDQDRHRRNRHGNNRVVDVRAFKRFGEGVEKCLDFVQARQFVPGQQRAWNRALRAEHSTRRRAGIRVRPVGHPSPPLARCGPGSGRAASD